MEQIRKDGERVGIFGSSGSGKTTKARQLIKDSRRLVIFDPKEEWLIKGSEWLSGKVDYVNNINSFFDVLKKRWKNGFKIVFTPQTGREQIDASIIARMIYMSQSIKSPNITLLIDEAQDAVPSGIAFKEPRNGIIEVARKGRDRGINLIAVSQRVKAVDIAIRANLSYTYFFKLRELSDLKEANQLVNDFQALCDMKNYDYFLIDKQGRKKFFKFL